MILSAYFTWHIIFVLFPSLLLLVTFRNFYRRYPKTILRLVLICFLIGFPWDVLVTDLGVWSFGRQKVLGVWFAGLPLEEILFLIFVPFWAGLTGLLIRRFWRVRE